MPAKARPETPVLTLPDVPADVAVLCRDVAEAKRAYRRATPGDRATLSALWDAYGRACTAARYPVRDWAYPRGDAERFRWECGGVTFTYDWKLEKLAMFGEGL